MCTIVNSKHAQWSIHLNQHFSMATSRPQDEEQINTTRPPTSGANWEQFLVDSTIWTPGSCFAEKFIYTYNKNEMVISFLPHHVQTAEPNGTNGVPCESPNLAE